MKAVLLAGGLGSRMGELTRTVNKHLLPVGNKPMLFWPLEMLVKNGFDEVLIVVGQKGCGEILRQAGDGSRFGAKFLYAFQEGEAGIAAALKLAEPFIIDRGFAVVLGDNIFPESLDVSGVFNDWLGHAHVFCVMHDHPELFGCAVLNQDGGRVEGVVEKPTGLSVAPVVTGLYFYDSRVFDVIDRLVPSARGELEISSVNDYYAKQGQLTYTLMEGGWLDCGTPELYKQANHWAESLELTKEMT